MSLIIGIIIIAAIVAFFVSYNTLTWGLVCYKFWYWFGLPVFTTLPQIDYWQAVGLTFFFSLFHSHNVTHRKQDDEEREQTLYNTLLNPWIVLLVGYIFKLIIN